MSSLLSKLKALFSAKARGPQPFDTAPDAKSEGANETEPVPEVTEASHRPERRPEVTEAPLTKQAPARPVSAAPRGPDRVKEQVPTNEQAETLEEERIVDLLKDEEA